MKILELHNLSKSFGGVHAVRHCSFGIEEKKITALIGPNGAGKTTVFNVVNGFVASDDGRVLFHGRDVTHMAIWERSRAGMSRTFQLSRIFKNLSIGENLTLAIRQEDNLFWRSLFRRIVVGEAHEMIQAMLEFVGLKKDLKIMAANLSYGEQKLFDLARALLNPHVLLLLDEPVAGVNPVIREKLKSVVRQLKMRGETVLLIEHDIDFVRSVADWIIVMDQGTIFAEGPPDKVLRDSRVLEAYLGSNQ